MIDFRLPEQHVYQYHLVMSIILLLLTAFPFLSNNYSAVSAFSSDEFALNHQFIDKFDIIQDQDFQWSKTIRTREIQTDDVDNIENERSRTDVNQADAITHTPKVSSVKKGQFFSLGRKFVLILDTKPDHLVTPDFMVTTLDANGVENVVPFEPNDIQVLNGYVEGETDSRATLAFSQQNKLLTALINTGESSIIVERTYLHKGSLSPEIPRADKIRLNESLQLSPKFYESSLIVYNLSDHRQFQESNNITQFATSLKELCASLKVEDDPVRENSSVVEDSATSPSNSSIDFIYKIYKKGAKKRLNRRGIEFLSEPPKERTRCTLHLVADYLFYKNVGNGELQTTINYILALITRVNKIFLPIAWDTGDDRTDKLSNVGFIVQNISVHEEFTRLPPDQIHYNMESDTVWNAREFLDNFSRHSPPRHYCLVHLLTYRQFDTSALGLAYVASPRFGTIGGICSPMQQKGDTFYKHNTGISTSKGISGETLITRQADLVVAHELGHNMGAEHDSAECRPSAAKGGSYLMHPFAVMGFEKNNRYMSECSKMAIGRVIKRKGPACFVGVIDHICGNGIVEDDEQCDGGAVGQKHKDPCCDSSCRFTPGSMCSDRHSLCCSSCRILPAGNPCRAAEDFSCKEASYCNGTSAECPPSPAAEDNTVCVGRGSCRNGDCTPFCEANDLISCLCNTPADACKLCCKTSPNGTCVPYDSKASYLPDGLLCYRGVCEKGRCEQPIQDFIERLWDVVEDVNFTTVVKFLRDNIILVILVVSIPVWCIFSHCINEFDKRVKQDLMNILARARLQNDPVSHSPFLPRLFVNDDVNRSSSMDDIENKESQSSNPTKQSAGFIPQELYPNELNEGVKGNGGVNKSKSGQLPPPHRPIGFRPHNYGFQSPEGEDVFERPGSLQMNSIELPYQPHDASTGGGDGGDTEMVDPGSETFSTQV